MGEGKFELFFAYMREGEMGEEEASNIFEAASHILGSDKGASKKGGKKREKVEGDFEREIPKDHSLYTDSLEVSFEKMKKLHDELESLMGRAFDQANLDPSMLRKFIQNPQNFSSREWKMMSHAREQEEESLWKRVGKKGESQFKKKKKKKKGEVSKKLRTKGRKGWIPMN